MWVLKKLKQIFFLACCLGFLFFNSSNVFAAACGTATQQSWPVAPTENLCSSGSSGGVTLEDTQWMWLCVGGTPTFVSCYAPYASEPFPVCGSSNGVATYTTPTALCSVGTPSSVTEGGIKTPYNSSSDPYTTVFNWTCSNGNGPVSCSAPKKVNAECEDLWITSRSSSCSGDFTNSCVGNVCKKGVQTTNTGLTCPGNGSWTSVTTCYAPTWTGSDCVKTTSTTDCSFSVDCAGHNGGTSTNCYVSIINEGYTVWFTGGAAPTPVDGTCGSSQGGSFTSAPSTNLCSAGTASSVTTGSTTYTWSCVGSNGGSTASCSANIAVNGSCGSANGTSSYDQPTNLCSVGTASSITINPTTFTWTCAGSGGGSTASCSSNQLTRSIPCGSYGDTSQNGVINYYDVQVAFLQMDTLPLSLIDVNGDADADFEDIYQIQQYVIGGISTFSVCSIVNGSCGTANGHGYQATSYIDTAAERCSVGTFSGSFTDAGSSWTWSCTGSGGGTTASCSAPKVACGSYHNTIRRDQPSTNLCAYGSNTTLNLSSNIWLYSCTNNPGVDAGCYTYKTTCGSSNGGSFTSAPSTNLCTYGTASSVTTGETTYTWTCTGNDSLAVSCSATRVAIVNGTCGSSNGGTFSTAPSTNLCSLGTATSVTTNATTYTWSCTGSGGGTTASCSSNRLINGVCGSSNGGTFSTAPTTNLCSAGNASAVSGTGPWTWNCNGINGGTNASCSANLSSVNGACGTANTHGYPATSEIDTAAERCTTGTFTSFTDAGSSWTWSCTGSGGGSTASCSAPKVACGSYHNTTRRDQPSTNLCAYGSNTTLNLSSNIWLYSCTNNPGVDAGCYTYKTTCGSSNGGTFSTAPTTNLCTYGTASAVTTGSTTYTWTCTGNDSLAVSCSATIATGSCLSCGGLTCTEIIDGAYIVHKYTGVGTCSWSTPQYVTSAQLLIVGGGGGGAEGQSGYAFGGSGGGGGLLNGTLSGLSGTYNVVVGAGGTQATTVNTSGGSGGNSSFGSYIAYGGGCGSRSTGCNGGSGGGGTSTYGSPTQTTQGTLTGYGNRGGTSGATYLVGGGGGATGVGGANNAYAANGLTSSITGTSTVYSLGGWTCGGTIAGGTGNGGGGCDFGGNGYAKAGDSGTVIIRYLKPVTGVCGSSNGGTFSTAPTTNLCSAGTASAVTLNGSIYNWTCAGIGGAPSVNCSATAQIINGICGSSNGGSFLTAPTTNLCSSGTSSSVTSTSSLWNWNCIGEPSNWYNFSWTRRKLVSITNSGSALTNYQVKLTVAYDSDMQADFDDLRFTSSNGTTELSYWLESKTNSSTATIWVKIPSLASGSNTIYVYYGNASAASASNGDNTFVFFDDFSGASISTTKWTISGSPTISSGIANINNGQSITQKTATATPVIFEVKYQRPSYYRNRTKTYPSPSGIADWSDFSPSLYWGGWTGSTLSNNTWYLFRHIYDGTNFYWKINNYGGAEIFSRNATYSGSTAYLAYASTESASSQIRMDFVIARKYAATEPTSSITTEENSPVVVSCSANRSINGAPGTASGKNYAQATTSYGTDTQCAAGTSTNTAFPAAGSSVTWYCNGINGGTNSGPHTASRALAGSCGTAQGGQYYVQPTGTALCASGTASTPVYSSNTWLWTCSGLEGGGSASGCYAYEKVDGAAGTASGKNYAQATTSYGTDTQCAAGTSTNTAFPAAGSSVTWYCNGINGGTNSGPHTASRALAGSCGTAQGGQYYVQPTGTALCASGTASTPVYSSNTWLWTCSGLEGGGSASGCYAYEKVDGVCGTAAKNYTYDETAFSGTMCSAGNNITTPASPVFPSQGSSTNWTCGGLNGGASSGTCTASRGAVPINISNLKNPLDVATSISNSDESCWYCSHYLSGTEVVPALGGEAGNLQFKFDYQSASENMTGYQFAISPVNDVNSASTIKSSNWVSATGPTGTTITVNSINGFPISVKRSPSSSLSQIAYNTTYYWWVKVKSTTQESDWISAGTYMTATHQFPVPKVVFIRSGLSNIQACTTVKSLTGDHSDDPCFSACWKGAGTTVDLTSANYVCSVCYNPATNAPQLCGTVNNPVTWSPLPANKPVGFDFVTGSTTATVNPIFSDLPIGESIKLKFNITGSDCPLEGELNGTSGILPRWQESGY